MPLLTLGVIGRIHWQALRLMLKRVPFFGKSPGPLAAHPSRCLDHNGAEFRQFGHPASCSSANLDFST